MSVLLEDVSKLGTALDALVTSGSNQMNGINFSIRDTAPMLAKARADAIADARTRAETYAKAAGVALGPIQSISEEPPSSPAPHVSRDGDGSAGGPQRAGGGGRGKRHGRCFGGVGNPLIRPILKA